MVKILNREQCITLPMILDQFSEQGKTLFWSFLELDILGDFKPGEYLDQIITKIWEQKEIIFLTWEELYEMANKFTVAIELTLVGCRDKKTILEIERYFKVPKDHYPMPEDIMPSYEILIDIDDGDLRGVLSKDKTISERCLSKFGPYPVGVYRTPIEDNK